MLGASHNYLPLSSLLNLVLIGYISIVEKQAKSVWRIQFGPLPSLLG